MGLFTESNEDQRPTCKLCGHPMPEGEEAFQYHGYSGPCPGPPVGQPKAQEKDGIVADLKQRLAAAEAERDEYKRLYDFRGKVLARPCLRCGYQPQVISTAHAVDGEPCDHEWETEDHSFDHEYGCEQIVVDVCRQCGKERPHDTQRLADDAI